VRRQLIQVLSSESWRFAVGIEELPNAALFVRDALDLEVPAGSGIPPHLAGPLPVINGTRTAQERREAGLSWPDWWYQILAHEIRMSQPGSQADRRAGLGQLAADIGTAPDFGALSDRPALRHAVQAAFLDGCRWTGKVRRNLLPPEAELFGWELIRAVAEEVTALRGVPLSVLQADVMVLLVEGIWWERFAPGVVLCSPMAADNPASARAIALDAFESYIDQ
jgi:hypothetical protein